MQRTAVPVVTVIALLLGSGGHGNVVYGDLIDFETGFAAGDAVGVVETDANTVTIRVGPGTTPRGDGFIAQRGDPIQAFCPNDAAPPPVAGDFFLTDELLFDASCELLLQGIPGEMNEGNSYLLTFAAPITNLSVDLYDFRTDGGTFDPGNVATLTLYADSNFTRANGPVDTFTVTPGLPDPNVTHLSIASPFGALSAALTFNQVDAGVAIDNIEFTTVDPAATEFVPGFTATPQDGEAPLTVRVDGSLSTAPGYSIARYEWDFGDGATAAGAVTEHTYQAGRFSIALTVTDDQDVTWTTSRTVTARCPSDDTSPWLSVDVGEPLLPGSASVESESEEQRLSICASGNRLSGREDSFHFAYQEYSGDTAFTARVMSLEGGTSPDPRTGVGRSQVGVMLRESLDPDASYVAMTLRNSGSKDFRFNYRSGKGGSTRTQTGPRRVEPPNAWVRIERQRDEFIASVSTDGGSWEQVGRTTLAGFPEVYYGGVFAAGGEPDDGSSFEALRAQFSVAAPAPPSERFIRSDCNDDGAVNIADATCILNWLFAGEADPGCVAATNANGDDAANITDATYLLNHLFAGGPAPVAPFPDCGPGTLPQELSCENPPNC